MGSSSKRKGHRIWDNAKKTHFKGSYRRDTNGGAFGNSASRWTLVQYWFMGPHGMELREEPVKLRSKCGIVGANLTRPK